MRTLFAVAAFVIVTSMKLAGQIIPPPTPRPPAAAQGTVSQGPGVYLVTFRPGTPAADKAAIVRATGARLRAAYDATNTAAVDLPDASALARLRNDPRVLSVFENRKIFLSVQGRGGSGGSKPKPPENLSATAASSSRINLSWSDGANNEDGFAVERCAGTGCVNFSEISRVSANIVTFADIGLSAETVYRYRVLAFNPAGASKYSNTAQATTQAVPPPPPPLPPLAPSNLNAAAITFSDVGLTWLDNSSDESGFVVERCIGSACTGFSEIFRTGANVVTYSEAGLAPQTLYRYRVLAFSGAGNSSYSNIAEANTPAAPPPPPTPPSAPSNLNAAAITFSDITLSWSDNSSDEEGFAIERCSGTGCSSFSEILRSGANVTSYADSGLTAQTVYRYRVRAFSAAGNSPHSNVAEATTPAAPPPPPPPPPTAPGGLTAAAISYSHVELSWSDNSGDEDGFRIERCNGIVATCTSFVQIAQVNADINALSDLGAQGQTTYTYRVRAFNSNGQSAYSSPAQVTTPAAPASTQAVPAGVQRIGAAPGALNWAGTGVGVAVVDTGLDFNHADLGLQPEVPGQNSFNATAMGTTCQDIHGHGTHVAGIIGAKNNLIDVVGVAPNATIYCVNVFEPDPDTGVSATDESLIAGLDWILTHANTLNPKIRVVNLSLGREKAIGDDNPNHPLRVAIRAVYNAGISIVVAAGNDPLMEVINEVPAFYPEVMAVASTTAEEGVNGYTEEFPACIGFQNIKADTASYFTTDGALIGGTGVTISAPGESREDLFDFGGSCFVEPIGILSLQAGGGTVELSGTSMAAPHVAGVLALMWEKEMTLGLNLSPDYARIRIRDNAIRRGTAPLDSLLEEYTFDGEREGVIWAPSALLDAPPPPQDARPTVTIVTPANNATFNTGASIAFSGTATDPEDGNIAASLEWTSDRDGHIGNGAGFNRTLTNGNHVITASLVDTAGNSGTASVSISVGSAGTPTTVRAGSVTYALLGSTLHYTVKLVNEFGGPVAGAAVRVSLYEWVYTGNLWFSNGVTDTQGNAHFQLPNADFGCYTTGVENVVAPGLTWTSGTPSNNYCRL